MATPHEVGTHEILWPRLCEAVRWALWGLGGPVPVSPKLEQDIHGSPNYRLMGWATWLLRAWKENPKAGDCLRARKRWLDTLIEMKQLGLFTLGGPSGVATEAGAGDPHAAFLWLPLVAVYAWALEVKDKATIALSEELFGGAVALAAQYEFRGVTCMPSTRAKKEKGQDGRSSLVDVIRWLIRGGVKPPVASHDMWWTQDYSLAAAVVRRNIVKGPAGWLRKRRLAKAAPAETFIEIKREDWHGGFIAWVEDEPLARASGIDWLSMVRHDNDGLTVFYQWGEGR